jgi:hypothetical protein
MNETQLLLLHLAASGFMVGLIWFVQIVHYPLFLHVGHDAFREYHRLHSSHTTRVVAGPMLLEAGTAGWLLFQRPALLTSPEFALATLLLVAIWLSTAFWQVPLHNKLAQGFDQATIHALVRSNWLRTIAWTVRGALIALIII